MTFDRVERAHRTRPGRTNNRQRPPMLALLLTLLLTSSGTSGCMVMDELDTAAAKMPTTAAEKEKSKKSDAKAAPAGAAERLAATKRMIDERSRSWWSEAKTMTPGESTAGVVSCRLPEGRRFMTRDDCLAQGGETGDGSG